MAAKQPRRPTYTLFDKDCRNQTVFFKIQETILELQKEAQTFGAVVVQNGKLIQENGDLIRENAELKAQLSIKDETIASQREEIFGLSFNLAKAKNNESITTERNNELTGENDFLRDGLETLLEEIRLRGNPEIKNNPEIKKWERTLQVASPYILGLLIIGNLLYFLKPSPPAPDLTSHKVQMHDTAPKQITKQPVSVDDRNNRLPPVPPPRYDENGDPL